MNNEGLQRIKEAGLKLTPQRREVYKAMQELRHATVEDIIERVQSRNKEVTVSTIYRILDSFRSANILSFIYHPDTGKCYYDITVAEHHHLFDGKSIEDYADPELSQLIREYLERKHFPTEEIGKVQVQVTLKRVIGNCNGSGRWRLSDSLKQREQVNSPCAPAVLLYSIYTPRQ